ncbi:hypothetical protein HY484_02035, partial [Candidatus Woesearchaeota archaeon]|nr:hypothetical protein [Candidatus Woesearchaeota archaeon]
IIATLEKGNVITEKEHINATYKELFDVFELERHQRFNPSLEGLKNMQKEFNRKQLSGRVLGMDNPIEYDAKKLSTGHRGVYRYIFDGETGNYVGLAVHTRGHGRMRYRWV